MTSLPDDLPALDVLPGPSRAEPLPPDRPVGWGILATGKIATAFASNLALLDECRIAAVGARRQESADAFAREHGAASAYGDYRALVEDPAVDVVYVATPHALHREHVELAFEAGKPVLCEKSLTLNAADAEELVALARERNLFLMEAMWMRCNPLVRRMQQLVHSGVLGEVQQVRADIGFVVDKPSTDRLLDPRLGGGALLDMGIYPLTFASLFLGEPSSMAATAPLS
jgi:predicted dehydrogenase